MEPDAALRIGCMVIGFSAQCACWKKDTSLAFVAAAFLFSTGMQFVGWALSELV